jgi:hypothetical protein
MARSHGVTQRREIWVCWWQSYSAALIRIWSFELNRGPIWRGKFFIHDVASVEGCCGFKYQNFRFRISHRAMLDATRHNTELASLQVHPSIAKFNLHLAAPHQEHFIFVLMMMPWKNACQLYKLNFVSV